MANRIEPEAHIDMRDDEPDLKKEQQSTTGDTSGTPAPAEKPADHETASAAVPSDAAAKADIPETPAAKPAATSNTDTKGIAIDMTPEDERTDATDAQNDPAVVIHSAGRHRLRHWFGTHKKIVIPVAVAVIVVSVLAALPFTRYAIAGTFVKQQFTVDVVDSQTGKPVSSVAVSLKGKTATTDNQGRTVLTVPVGKSTLSLDKHFYKATSQQVLVPLRKPAPLRVMFTATGRQVPVTVTNKITGKVLNNATVSAEGTKAITDKNGEATIVLPADKQEVKGTIAASGYNQQAVNIKITTAKDAANAFMVTPAGKVYFLSNASGTVDVVKTDLDGGSRQTVLKGTGKEENAQTVLLASQNWKYLALLSKREGGANAKLYLIDTSNDALTTMDEGDARFSLIGWSGSTFIYQVNRNNKQNWDTKAAALKSFDAATKKLATLDETIASGAGYGDYFYESYVGTYILDNEVVFGKSIYAAAPSFTSGHAAGLYSVKPDGTDKKTVKTWSAEASRSYVDVSLRPYEPNGIYVGGVSSDSEPLYEYEGGQLKTVEGKKATQIWEQQYDTYLFSPSNKLTLWSTPRDGKNTLFVGDSAGKNEKQLASLVDYQTFGWYTDDYVLLSKNGSELYVAPPTAWGDKKPLKITDYFKPDFYAPGYGKGYGGI